jgi:hypothetical protein
VRRAINLVDISIKSISSFEFYNRLFKERMIGAVRKWYRQEAERILKSMDLSGGSLNFSGIEVLREVESNGAKWHQGILPSRSLLQRMSKKVEQLAHDVAPFNVIDTEHGPSIAFDREILLKSLLQAHDLWEPGKQRSISLAGAMDGAEISKSKKNSCSGSEVS